MILTKVTPKAMQLRRKKFIALVISLANRVFLNGRRNDMTDEWNGLKVDLPVTQLLRR
jgi:hypothetical protein